MKGTKYNVSLIIYVVLKFNRVTTTNQYYNLVTTKHTLFVTSRALPTIYYLETCCEEIPLI